MRFAALFITLATSLAHAGFDEERARLENSGNRIDQKLGELKNMLNFGFERRKDKDHTSEEKPSSLFRVHGTLNQLRAPVGTLLTGKTTGRLIVGPEGAPAIVELLDGQGIFSGLRILGQARQAATEGRLLIELDRVVFRSGRALHAKAMVMDNEGAYGLKAQVFTSKALMLAGSIAASSISGFAASQQTQGTSSFGFSQPQPTTRNGVLQGVAQTAADQSKRLIEDATKEKPVLVVDTDTPVQIFLDEEIRF